MTPEQLTPAIFTEDNAALVDLLREAAKASMDHERGSSASLTIKIKRDKDSGILQLLATVKASYPTSETETTTIKMPSVTLATITPDHPGQTRLEFEK